jgi:hypothetical protein
MKQRSEIENRLRIRAVESLRKYRYYAHVEPIPELKYYFEGRYDALKYAATIAGIIAQEGNK